MAYREVFDADFGGEEKGETMNNMEEETDDTVVDDTFDRAMDFEQVIASDNWRPPGEYYQFMPTQTRTIVSSVVASDERLRKELRETWLPEMERQGTIQCWKKAHPKLIAELQHKMLYTGRVYAADGTLAKYTTLSLVGAQIAISKVSYRGGTGQIVSNMMHWGQEIPRQVTATAISQAIRSRKRMHKNGPSNLFLYALMTYKEREVLLDTPPDAFKLIQGPIFPHEMLTGAGRGRVMTTCLDIIGKLIDDGAYATIISNSTDTDLLDLGLALDAGEYIVVDTGTDVLMNFLYEDGDDSKSLKAHYTNRPIPEYGNRGQIDIFKDFMGKYGSRVVRGVLRAHRMSRPYIFFCNKDRLDEAVHMLLADAANTGPRGFPLLVDLADQYCSGSFKASEYTTRLNAEFARASGGSVMYQSERSSRD
ncbi:hypothetical protein [Dictyobacter arantiisoli]|uniref:NurA domain-containing protein n=1 Tax=Dictyobacter arantiisoli TaxID=2014874 RepID=A0A5A5TKG8_9CHLR|nr:hypothetical protein [Dictyobacter arantiisoli]GCF11394.1 hypothetical protein KDI_49580 [Dictyobacter arantiisoli]